MKSTVECSKGQRDSLEEKINTKGEITEILLERF